MISYLPPFYLGLLLVLVFILGTIFGSFLNCSAWRIVHGEKISHGRSHCPECNHVLGVFDLIPLVSWLCLRGRCRYCGKKISPRYPASELVCGLGFVSLVLKYEFSVTTLMCLLLFCLMLTLSLVDLEDGWIPDRLLIIGAVGYVVFALCQGSAGPKLLLTGLIGAAALFVPMLLLVLIADKVMGRESMGGGDLKLYALLGMYLGWKMGILLVILSCIFGLVSAKLMNKMKPNTPFPFGPAICAAAWAVMLVGDPIITWYLSLF